MLFAARSAASHFCRFLISLGSIKIFIQGAGEKVRESEKFYAVVERRGTERGGEREEGAVLRVARVPLPIHLDISFTSERPERYEFDGRLSRMDSFSAIKKVGKKKEERKKGRNGGQREGGREGGRQSRLWSSFKDSRDVGSRFQERGGPQDFLLASPHRYLAAGRFTTLAACP